MDWKSVGVVTENQPLIIGDLNVWDHEWISLKEPHIQLPHPSYPIQLHGMHQYEIRNGTKKIRFAAGELSANVWGFYVPG